MICPNQPLVCDAYSRSGSMGDPLRWYISQPAKCGPLTSHFSRLSSDVNTNAPLRVPTDTRTVLILVSLPGCRPFPRNYYLSRAGNPMGYLDAANCAAAFFAAV